MKIILIFALFNTYILNDFQFNKSPKTIVTSPIGVSIEPFVVGDILFMETKKCGIYKITNPKNKIYIGQSANLEHRKYVYKLGHCKGQVKLYNSMQKYGPNKHAFEVIHLCEESKLDELESYYISLYQSNKTEHGLNLRPGGPSYPRHKGKQIGEKIGNALRGKKRTSSSKLKGKKISETHRLNIIKSLIGNKRLVGHKHSDEYKKIMSERHIKLGIKLPKGALEKSNAVRSIKVNQYNENGDFIATHKSFGAAGRSVGCCHANINQAVRCGMKAMGYYWKRADSVETEEDVKLRKNKLNLYRKTRIIRKKFFKDTLPLDRANVIVSDILKINENISQKDSLSLALLNVNMLISEAESWSKRLPPVAYWKDVKKEIEILLSKYYNK